MPWFGYALLAALCIAAVGMMQKRILREEHSLEYVTLFSLIRLLLVLLVFGSQIVWVVNFEQAGLLLGGAGVGAVAFFLTIKAIERHLPGKMLAVALILLGTSLIIIT